MGWQDDPAVEQPQSPGQSAQGATAVADWQSDPPAVSEARGQYLRDKYAYGLSAPIKGARDEYTKGAIQEITDPAEQQFLADEVSKIAQSNEWAQNQEYNQSGYLKRFGKNIQKVAGHLYEGYREAGALPGRAAGILLGSETPEQTKFKRSLEDVMQRGNPTAEQAPGVSGSIASATAGMFPMIQTAGAAGGATGAGARLLGATPKLAGLAGEAAAAATFAPGMYENTYGKLLDKGASPATAKWAAAASATLQSAVFARIPQAILPKLGGQEVVAKTITQALVKNYGKALLKSDALVAGAAAIDSTAKELAQWADGKGVPDAGAIFSDTFEAAKKAIVPLGIIGMPRGAQAIVVGANNVKITRIQNDILQSAADGTAPSRSQWKEWGLEPLRGLSKEGRLQGVQWLAQEIQAARQPQTAQPAEAPPEVAGEPTKGQPEVVTPTEVPSEAQPEGAPPEMPPEFAPLEGTPETAPQPPMEAKAPITSLKAEVMDSLRAARGVEALMPAEAESFQGWLDSAEQTIQTDPSMPDRLITELQNKPRTLSGEETAALNLHYRGLYNADSAAFDRLMEATKGNDLVALERAQVDSLISRDRLSEIETTMRSATTKAGQSLVAIKMALHEDYTPAAMARRVIVAKGGKPLTANEIGKITDIGGNIGKLQDQLAHLGASQALDDAIAELTPKKSFRKSSAKRIAAQQNVKVAWAEFKQSLVSGPSAQDLLGGESGALNVNAVASGAKLVKAYIDLGITTFSEFMAHASQQLGNKAEESRGTLAAAWKQVGEESGIPPLGIDPNNPNSLRSVARKITRSLLEAGVVGRENVVDAVYEELQKVIPDITRYQTEEAIARHPFQALSKESVDVQMREITRDLQLLLNLEDYKKGIAPPRMREGQTPTDYQRELQQQINEAAKKYRIVTPASETQLKSALDAAKTGVRNRIADMEKEISTREKIVKTHTELKPDKELESLRAKRDALKEEHAQVFPKQPATEAQKITAAGKALDRAISQLEGDIKEGKIGFKKRAESVYTPELEAKRTKLDDLRQKREELRDAMNPKPSLEERQHAAYKRGLQNRLEELQRKVEEGDISKREVKHTVQNKETVELKYQIQLEQDKFKALEDRVHKSQLTGMARAFNMTGEALNFSRAVMTSMDLSAILRQGGVAVAGHPILAAKSFPEMLRAFASKKGEFAAMEALRKRPNAQLYVLSKLALMTSEGKLSQQEEAFFGTWASKIPGIAGSERAYVTFLNRMRADMFDSMAITLGRSGNVTIEEARVIANYINVATGRADFGKLGGAADALATAFFSPRYAVSRFQFLVGQPLMRGNTRTRVLIAKEYARSLAGMATFFGMAYLGGYFYTKKEDKPQFEWDARSVEFGKVRYGDVIVDPLAGLSQTTVLISRLITGKTKKATGEIIATRGPDVPFNGLKTPEIIARFLRGKLAPAPGAAVDILSGENVVGDSVTPLTAIGKALVPLSFRDIYDTMQANGISKKMALSLLVILGVGAQKYQNAPPERFAQKISQHPNLISKNKQTRAISDYTDEVSQVVAEAKKRGISEGELITSFVQKMKAAGHKSDAINDAKARLHRRFNTY